MKEKAEGVMTTVMKEDSKRTRHSKKTEQSSFQHSEM